MSLPTMDDSRTPDWQLMLANATVNICDTWVPVPYRAVSVACGLGKGKPQNPTCVEVDVVKRTS
jgi:hypothetical protein